MESDKICEANKLTRKENSCDDIKDYAESTMNELLGWYGYATKLDPKSSGKSSNSGKDSSEPDSPKTLEGCGWCGKPIGDVQGLSSSVASFCSELCFSQSRRATFKRSKTCDWCRHVRHTVAYVDFQDGVSQLQFCSDKCLNQYKMHIFCRETRAHLELHPHIGPESACDNGLITPDLWLKNCKSPEPYEGDDASPPPFESAKLGSRNVQTSPLPLITVTPSSKLMPPASEQTPLNLHASPRSKSAVKVKKSRNSNSNASKVVPANNDLPQDLRVRHDSSDRVREEDVKIDTGSSETFQNSHQNNSTRDSASKEQFSANSSPKIFPEPNFIPPQYFNTQNRQNFEKFLQHSRNLLSPFSRPLPPVTIMVPYPVIVPIPLPIPIPIQMSKIWPEGVTETERKVEDSAVVSPPNVEQQNSSQTNSDRNSVIANADLNDSSQETKVVVEDMLNVDKTEIIRPLRKRKKAIDPKQIAKPAIKTKKSI